MPFNPSDIPWWGWLILAVIPGAISFGGATLIHDTTDESTEVVGWILMIVSGIAALLSFVIGIVRLVKWAWIG